MKMRPNENLGQHEYNTKDSINYEHVVCMLAASLLVVGRTFVSVFSVFTAAPTCTDFAMNNYGPVILLMDFLSWCCVLLCFFGFSVNMEEGGIW